MLAFLSLSVKHSNFQCDIIIKKSNRQPNVRHSQGEVVLKIFFKQLPLKKQCYIQPCKEQHAEKNLNVFFQLKLHISVIQKNTSFSSYFTHHRKKKREEKRNVEKNKLLNISETVITETLFQFLFYIKLCGYVFVTTTKLKQKNFIQKSYIFSNLILVEKSKEAISV